MERLLRAANTSLALSILAMAVSVLVAYPYAEHFSMAIQITAHMVVIIFALVLKVSYVARLVALKDLGRPMH